MGVPNSLGVMASLKTWNKLHPAHQEVISAVNEEMRTKWIEIVMDAEETAVKSTINDLDFYYLPDDESAKWRAVVDPESMWDQWIDDMEAKGLPGQEMFDTYMDLIDKYKQDDIYVNPFTMVDEWKSQQ